MSMLIFLLCLNRQMLIELVNMATLFFLSLIRKGPGSEWVVLELELQARIPGKSLVSVVWVY
jgi:hypothetical protein